ncbi:porin [Limnohabitans sp.]|uniref:porin n=1 Tax=Limnohabitans sp. TaxID=1907725 RepID=UPI00286F1507|nr:porin [Limnohabitans sp.]
MKKTLVALAALAATSAFAQSSVQLDGNVDAGYQSVNYKGNSVTGVAGNGSSTSQLNVRGNEDLGGGLRATFRVETDWNMVSNLANTGTSTGVNIKSPSDSINGSGGTFGNGEVRLGLESATYGQIHFGAVNYNTLGTFLTGQPFGTAIGSGFRTMYINDAQGTSQVRAENAVKYVTPTFSGFQGTLYKSNKQDKATKVAFDAKSVNNLNTQPNAFSTAVGAYDQVGTQELGLNYANGPWAASYSALKQDFVGISAVNASAGAAGTAVYKVNTLAGAYTMGNAKFMALNQSNTTDTGSVKNSATTLSATYTLGQTVLMAQTGSLKSSAGASDGKKSTFTGFGADYKLSKMSALYFRAESVNDEAGAMNAALTPAAIKGTDTKFARTALGLRIGF